MKGGLIITAPARDGTGAPLVLDPQRGSVCPCKPSSRLTHKPATSLPAAAAILFSVAALRQQLAAVKETRHQEASLAME